MTPRFSLQPVLEYRHNRVEALEVELGNLIATRQRGLNHLETLHLLQAHLFGELHARQEGVMDLTEILHLRSNLKTAEARIHRQRQDLAELEQQIHQKRLEVISAKKEEEMLVTLKNKEIERYQAEQARLEGSRQDDIYIAQAFRRTQDVLHG